MTTTLKRAIANPWQYARRARFICFPNVVCNICGWRGEHLANDCWHEHSVCPGCRSEVRHRLLAASLDHLDYCSPVSLLTKKRVLHFAPEPFFQARFQPLASEYTTADFLKPEYDLQLDLCDMANIPDASIDTLIACDVIEHVPNDIVAMKEILRVLDPAGTAILTVPQARSLDTKRELPPNATESERLELAGQEDHQRIYGRDFGTLLETAGFTLTEVTASSFSDQLVRRHVLFPPVLSDHPLATNHRSILFASKANADS